MTDRVEIVRSAEVPQSAAESIERIVSHLAQDPPGKRKVDQRSWYHDEPIWFVIEVVRELDVVYRVTQFTVVREGGALYLEIATHLEYRTDGFMILPLDKSTGHVEVFRIPLDRLDVEEVAGQVRTRWTSLSPDAPDVGMGPDWLSIPMSPAVHKP